MVSINIRSENYSGKTALVTFYPYSGGTISLGLKEIPFDYITEYYYGTYSMYFEEYDNTCVIYVLPTTTTTTTHYPTPTPTPIGSCFLLQENGFYILQENGSKLIIQCEYITPTPTPTTPIDI